MSTKISNLPAPEEQFGQVAEDAQITATATEEVATTDSLQPQEEPQQVDFTDEDAALAANSSELELEAASPSHAQRSGKRIDAISMTQKNLFIMISDSFNTSLYHKILTNC